MICPICNSKDSKCMLNYKKYPLYIKPVPLDSLETVPLVPLNIRLCNKCGLVYQELNFDIKELSKIYEIVYKSYHSPVISGIGSSLANNFLEFLENNVNLKNKNALEIGCYDGYFLSLLRNKHSCDVVGCDPSLGSKIAEQIGIDVVNDYFSSSLFHNRTFDIIILRGIVEHIINPINFLKDVREVVSDSGIIAIEVPNVKYSLKNGVIGDFFHEHISYFTKDSLIHCLHLSGFELVKIDDTGYYLQAIFKKATVVSNCIENSNKEILDTENLFIEYNENVERLANELVNLSKTLSNMEIYIYGGGGHTIGLLSKTCHFLKPMGVIDGDPSKEGKYIPGFKLPVYSKKIIEDIVLKKSVLIVSSKIFQNDIVNELRYYIKKGLKVVSLYPKVSLSSDEGDRI